MLVVVDDLGWRDLGFLGADTIATPNLDRLARAGMVFGQAYAAAPNCAPSRASLLTGQYPPRHGIYTNARSSRGEAHLRRLVPVPTRTVLAPEAVTLAEALRERGYATGHVGKWHLGGKGHLPVDEGFDVNLGGEATGMISSRFHPYAGSARQPPGLEAGAAGEYLTDRLTDEAIAFLARNADRPFFLHLAYYAVHTPYAAPAELVEKYERQLASREPAPARRRRRAAFSAMVELLDANLGRLVAALEEEGRADDSVLFVVSDNGGLGPPSELSPLRGGKGTLYEAGIRVPLLVWGPGRVSAGRWQEPVSGVDLFPTILELAGAPAAGPEIDGVSLVPVLRGGELPPRDLFWHFPAYLQASRGPDPWRLTPTGVIRSGDEKLFEFFEDGRLELYDLATDPEESHDLAAERPERARALRARLEAWRAAVGAPVPRTPNPDYAPPVARGGEGASRRSGPERETG